MATSSLGTLTLDLIARTGGFVKGMSKAERESKKWRKSVERHLRKVGGEFARVAKLAAGAGVATAGAFALMARDGLQFVDSQAKLAARIGSTVDDLRAMQLAASDFGIEQGQLTSSLQSYTKRLGDAARGTGEAQKAYEALGLEAKDLLDLPLPEQMALIAERIAEVDSAAERASIADRLMSGGRRMVNLFEDGGEAIREAGNEVDALGLKLNSIETQAVEDANDAIARIPLALEPIKNQIAINLAEPLENVAGLFTEAAKASNGFALEVTEGVAVAIETIAELMTLVDDLVGTLMKIQRFQAGVEAFAEQTRMNIAGQGMGRMQNYGMDNPEPETGPLTERYNELDALIRDYEENGSKLGRIADAVGDQVDVVREGPERRARMQAGLEAGLGMEDGVTSDAISGSLALVDALSKVTDEVEDKTEKTEDDTEATKDHTEKTKNASDAVKDFGDTAADSVRAIQAAMDGMGDDPRYGFDPDEGTSSSRARARFDASANRIGDPNVINYGGNDSARPTWSREFLTNPETEPASPRAPWFGGDAGIAKVQSTASSVVNTSAGGAGRTAQVTLNVVGENGTESATGTIGETLLSMLEKAAAGSR